MNIYVGNLPFMITEDKLMDHFVAFGEVSSVKLFTDKITGEARGFGFVEMPIQSEAEAAIKALKMEQRLRAGPCR
jgi:RNA recognition motif-containing protein